MKLGALDLGSNSFHLVIAESSDSSQSSDARTFTVVERAKEMVRLGEETLRTQVIPRAGFERGVGALVRMREVTRRHELEALLVVGTATLREARNGGQFCRVARETLGVEVHIADEREEARLIYIGALSSLSLADRRVALFDLGGGSLDLLAGDARGVHASASLKLGGLRLAERWLRGDPPSPRELAALRGVVRAALAPEVARLTQAGFDLVAFCSGTAKALRAMSARQGVKPASISYAELLDWEGRLTSSSAADRREIAGLHPRRVDSIVAGVVVLRIALELTGHDRALFCRSALREGMILDYLARRAGDVPTAVHGGAARAGSAAG